MPVFKFRSPCSVSQSSKAVLISGLIFCVGLFQQLQPSPTLGVLPLNIPTIQLTHLNNNRPPEQTLGQFYFMLGTQMAARGQLIAAEGLLANATRLLPKQAEAFMNYGVVLEALEKNEAAIKAYLKSIELDPNSPQSFYSLGLLLDTQGKTDEGIQQLQRALRLDPDNYLIHYDIGVMYAKKNDYQNSAIYSKNALSAGDFAEAYNNYGYALAHLGQHQAALDAINQSLKIKPDSAAALDSRGFAYYGMGKYEEAIADYKKALDLDPTIGEIYQHLGEAYAKLNQKDKAIQSYETYMQLSPKADNLTDIRQRLEALRNPNKSSASK